MTYKIQISKSGYNAKTETDPNNLIFSSDYNTLKYYSSGNVSFNVTGTAGYFTTYQTVTHNLGYRPFFSVYADWIGFGPTGIFYLPNLNSNRELTAAVDTTKLYLVASGLVLAGTETFTANFNYKLFTNNLGL